MNDNREPGAAGRIVIAGGRGFIGRHLTRHLTALDHEVVILTRSSTPRPMQRGRLVPWTPDSQGPWCSELNGARAVVNLCGAPIAGPRWTNARKRHLEASRTLPTRTLVTAMERLDAPPALLVQASGVGYFGATPGQPDDPSLDEQAPPGSDFLARLAVAWEAAAADARAPCARMRFGVVLGRDGGALPQMLLPFRLYVGGRIGSGRQWLPWVHVHDAVRAIAFVIEHALPGAFNVVAPEAVSNATFAGVAAHALRRPALLPLPRLVLQAALGEQATLLCDGQRVEPKALLRAGFRFQFPDIDGALADLTR
ncbi:MAG: TIGR01777 family oxidoreductase [Pseudomonadales bacterium]